MRAAVDPVPERYLGVRPSPWLFFLLVLGSIAAVWGMIRFRFRSPHGFEDPRPAPLPPERYKSLP